MKEYIITCLAGWQSGYAAACKAVYAGSIPASASIVYNYIQTRDIYGPKQPK